MIKHWKRIPRGWKVILDGVVALILLFVLWIILECPLPTGELAFRRSVSGAGLPTRDPDLILELEYDRVDNGKLETTDLALGLLAEGDHVLRVSLDKKWFGWKSEAPLLVVPAAEGVYYTPLPGWGDNLHGFANKERFFQAARGLHREEGPCDVRVPAFAVKAPGTDASLTLILGDCQDEDGATKSGGRFPLLLEEAEGGWFVFRWYSLDIINHLQGEESRTGGFTDESYWVLNRWMEHYDIEGHNLVTAAHLELTTRDAEGKVLNQVTWELP
ncbi:MAG: hypothetical protein J5789_01055 [Oscillospiraceae bacterium]|nr:hypothetical protein [Oscillospiraceae bacterium]